MEDDASTHTRAHTHTNTQMFRIRVHRGQIQLCISPMGTNHRVNIEVSETKKTLVLFFLCQFLTTCFYYSHSFSSHNNLCHSLLSAVTNKTHQKYSNGFQLGLYKLMSERIDLRVSNTAVTYLRPCLMCWVQRVLRQICAFQLISHGLFQYPAYFDPNYYLLLKVTWQFLTTQP